MDGHYVSQENVVKFLNTRNVIINKNFKYTGCYSLFSAKCKKHNFIYKTSYAKIRYSPDKTCNGCIKCANEKRSQYQKKIKQISGKRLSNLFKRLHLSVDNNFEYKDVITEFYVTCLDCGFKQKTKLSRLLLRSKCFNCEKKRFENKVKKCIINKGGTISGEFEYVNTNHKFIVSCGNGHKFETCANRLLSAECWCPDCDAKKTENEFRSVIESIFSKPFQHVYPKWLRVKTYSYPEIDGYNEDLKVAFEYQGEQHFNKNHFFHKISRYGKVRSWNKLKKTDSFKIEMCNKMGITLIIVPYNLSNNKWKDLIRKTLKLAKRMGY